MKFTDGNWMMRPGVTAHYAAEAYEVRDEGDALTILAPCRPIRSRGDTLQGPALTVRLDSPMPGVVRVKVEHFQGRRDPGPHFALEEAKGETTTGVTEDHASLTTGALTARVDRKSWRIDFLAEGKPLTQSLPRSTALMETAEGKFVTDQLSLGVGENVYGLGERFTAFVKNGQSVDIWNADGGTNSEQAYKNVPFYLTNRGYGVFVNSPAKVSFEVGTEKTTRVGFSVPGDALEYLVVHGPTPKEVLQKYTALTGRPALPPKWSFGLWLSTSFTTNYDEATVNAFIDGMAGRDIPLGVFHYDCFWMKGFHWTDFEWDPAVFPDPKGMLARLKAKGLKVCVWINPYIAQAASTFKEAMDAGYLLKRPNGDVWQWDLWQPGMALVDFTNPDAVAWFKGKIAALVDMGVDAIKTDFGERIPEDVAYFDGADPHRMHNYYTELYNRAVFEALDEKTGEPVLFARSATVGRTEVPRPLGRRLLVHLRGDGRVAARRPLAGPLGLRLLEPRHRRLRGQSAARSLQAMGRVRAALVPLAAPRLVVLPRPVARRRGVGGRPALLHEAQGAPHALPLVQGRRGPPNGRPDDARDGPGVSRRPRLRRPRPPVHAGRLAPRRAGLLGRRGGLLRPDGPLDLAPRRPRRRRPPLGPRDAWLPLSPSYGPRGHPPGNRRGRQTDPYRPRRRRDGDGVRRAR